MFDRRNIRASTVIGFYDQEATAQQVIQELQGKGFNKNAIDHVRGSDGSSSFRNDYTYEQSQPAYRYGYTMASDARYKGRDWNAVEKDVKGDWKASNQGTWEQFKDSVRYAWERVKGSQLS
jgi:hypothetical protein